MKTADLKVGDKIQDVRFDSVSIIRSITEKRITMSELGRSWETSTGRIMNTFWLGHKSFQEHLDKGEYIINNN